jgi:urocanate hydratase
LQLLDQLKNSYWILTLMQTKNEANNTKAIFRVIDHDLHSDLDEKPVDCVIYYTKNGSIESYDSYQDSLRKFLIENVYGCLHINYEIVLLLQSILN